MKEKSVLKRIFGACILIVASTLAGCAGTTQAISNAEKAKLTVVTLNEHVPHPQQMYYLGPGEAAGTMFGLVGALLAAPGSEAERQAAELRANRAALIERIVYEEALAQLRASGKFPLAEHPVPGSATMQVSITLYGFTIPHGFSSKLIPLLSVQFELRDASGRVLWAARDRISTINNPVEAVDAEEFMRNPAAMEAAWREAAKALSKAIVASY